MTMPENFVIILVPLLPLLGFVVLAFFGKKFGGQTAGWFGTMLSAISAAIALVIAYGYFFSWGKPAGSHVAVLPFRIPWLTFTPSLSIDLGVLLDPISVMMLVVVTFISLMVHVFSLDYMKGEDRFPTYYAFLSLFTFSMLGLVMSSNLFQMYIFWELVGVSSFLLIGFYYAKPSAVAAARKAFIVTRFADLGFLIGILILSHGAQTLDFQTLIHRLTSPDEPVYGAFLSQTFLGCSAVSWGLALVFIGGAGKSAMFPLHIWLPDAMEGPTPVSALIHAATMVVAGVFLVARLFPAFALTTPALLEWIGYTGAFSALFAAVIACTQTDIKRVLAYSTMSQIGFMMLALGVSGHGGENGLGFTASQFHLFTHALFKALLFLGAGVVIHAVHSNELKDMGGLRKHLPVTHFSFLVACLAISGMPPLSGFFSKEEILLAAYRKSHVMFGVALFTSGLTAFYMFRLYFSIFWNRPSSVMHHRKEGGPATILPLMILAVGAMSAGFIPFSHFVTSDGMSFESHLHPAFSIAPVLTGLAGMLVAAWMYRRQSALPQRMATALNGLHTSALNKFYIDEVYLFVTKKVLFNLIGRPAAWFDRHVVDGLVNLTGHATVGISGKVKGLQSGRVQQYAFVFLGGLLLLLFMVVYLMN